MKADQSAQRRLLDLAGIDAELSRLTHRRRSLPEHAELAEAEAAVRAGKDAVIEIETRAGDLDRDIRRLERDVEGVRARTERDRSLMQTAGAKQAVDLQHELDTLARRQEVLEDEQLEVMERREAVGADLEHSQGVLAAAEERVSAVVTRRDGEIADIDAGEAGRRRDREATVATLPEDLLAAYEKRRTRRGTGAAPLRERRCGSCRLELDRTAVAALRSAPDDEVVYCEECGVILVRTAESGL